MYFALNIKEKIKPTYTTFLSTIFYNQTSPHPKRKLNIAQTEKKSDVGIN